MKRNPRFALFLLLTGLALSSAACAGATQAAMESQPNPGCDLPVCAELVVTQDGRPGQLQTSTTFAPPADLVGSRWKIDTGLPSPDGTWVAYTSISSESGGPVFLQNRQSGDWTNLIEAINAHTAGGKSALAEDYGWDVIGWFPDGQRLMIGPVDLSLVLTVDLATFAAQPIQFPGGGRGGRMFANLSPDGSRLLYVGDAPSGEQVLNEMDLGNGQSNELLRMAYAEGVLSNPRYSPDQSQVAYLLQTGQPDASPDYAIHLLSTQTGQTSLLVDGNLDVCVPTWSPDGRTMAFVRKEPAASTAKSELPAPIRSDVWVITLADRQETQVTFSDGTVRSPAWAQDSQTLAFVGADGQVELANLAQPGQLWQASQAAGAPELTSAFFLP